MCISDLPALEDCFNVSINVYSLNEDNSCTRIYACMLDSGYIDELNLNLTNGHFGIILNMAAYASKYACSGCGKLFSEKSNLIRHEKSCQNKVMYKYPGGIYIPKKSVFEEMKNLLGIDVDEKRTVFPWFAVYDFESMLVSEFQNRGETIDSNQIEWTQEHVPVAVSMCSNVLGFEDPFCIVEKDVEALLFKMFQYLKKIQTQMKYLSLKYWEDVILKIDESYKFYSKLHEDNKDDYDNSHNAGVRCHYIY